MRIALIAGRPKIGKKEDNLRKMEEFIKKEDADLLCLANFFFLVTNVGMSSGNLLSQWMENL